MVSGWKSEKVRSFSYMMDKNYFRYAFLSGGRSCLCLKDPEKLIKIYSWEADWQLSIFPLLTILCITCMAPLLWSAQVGYLFPCSPRKNYIVPLRPQNKILIFYVLCSPKLPVFTPVFRSLFPWSSEKMPLFICSRKPWENLIIIKACALISYWTFTEYH